METRANHLLIGLFVLLAFVGTLLFALWLKQSPGGDADARAYRVIFQESVQGLAEGSPVQYNGIPVGNVTALNLDADRPNQVVARILVRATTPIREDTTATLAMQGLAGRSIIQLRGGTSASPVLQSTDAQGPIIRARPSAVGQIVDQGEQTVANLNALTRSALQLLTPENLAAIHATLIHVEQISAALAEQRGEVGALVVEGRTTLQQIQQSFARLDKFAHTLTTTVGAHAPRIAANLDKSTAALADVLHANKVPLHHALQGASTIGTTLNELRATLAALRTTLERLNTDPAGYLLNRNPLPEFTP